MPCFRPQTGFRALRPNPKTGLRPIVQNYRQGYSDLQVTRPCGQCRFCRLEDSRQWAIRAVHEASLYKKNSFLTLTYAPEFLPRWGSWSRRHPVLFMKRLREKYGEGIRSFGCAEYGEKNDRPHYHILLFNHDFDDKVELTKRGGYQLYKSEELSKLWGMGHCVIGSVEFESAGYVARYCTKKYTGPTAPLHYWDGEIRRGRLHCRRPEGKVCLSRMPGVGKPYFEKWMSDMYPRDQVIVRERVMKPPKYYDSLFKVAHPEEFRKIKLNRKWKATEAQEKAELEFLELFARTGRGHIHQRALAIEECLERKTQTLIRNYENDSQGVHSLRFEGGSVPQPVLHADSRIRYPRLGNNGQRSFNAVFPSSG